MKANYFLISILLAGLGACGGGGGDNPTGGTTAPSPTVQVTQANGAQVAAVAMEADTAAETGSALLPFNVQESGTEPETSIASVTQMIVDLLRPSTGIRPLFHEGFCDSGSISAPHNVTSGTVSFNNCEVAGLYFNGSVDFSYRDSGTAITYTLDYRDFTVSTISELLATFNGDLRVEDISSAGNSSLRLSGSVFLFESASDNVALYNFIIEVSIDGSWNSTESFTYTVNSNLINGTVSVTTNPAEGGAPLQYVSGSYYPTSGAVVVIGVNNSRVRVTATGSANPAQEVMIEYAPAGDGNYDPALTEYMSWSQFDLLSDFVNI